MRPELANKPMEDIMKEFDRHKEEAKKHGVNVVFRGSPWGTSEGVVVVYDIGSMENYTSFVESGGGGQTTPFMNNRTHLVLEW